MADHDPAEPGRRPTVSRRRLFAVGGGGVLAGAAAVGLGAGVARGDLALFSPAAAPAVDPATELIPFHGEHQAGVATPAQAHIRFAAFDLRPDVGRDGVAKLLRLLTDDIRRMTSGRPALGDTAPELAAVPSRLSVTVGFGPGLFDRVGLTDRRPLGLTDLPAFPQIDRLEDRWSGGDLLLQIGADDPTTVAHTARMLLKDARAFATPRWFQDGFLRARGSGPAGSTPRNLMGQLDGTVNPAAGSGEFGSVVWSSDAGWFAGGTTLVLRRIRMDLDGWDELDRSAMETVVGRTLGNGAPLTGTSEFDEPDFAARDATGLPAIADFAHIRLSRGNGPANQLLRRPYNYDLSPAPDGNSDLGLLFASYQADIAGQFTPMQQRLADSDPLNEWTTPIGSAIFAIPPGCGPDGYLGEGLLTS